MNIVVKEELRAYIDPLTPEEHEALERSILAEGCRDALVLWGDVLVDGHNRYGICQKHDIPFNTVQHPHFKSMEDVHLWMIDQHLGRRSVSDFQRGVLALRKKEILAAKVQAAVPAPAESGAEDGTGGAAQSVADGDAGAQAKPAARPAEPLPSREALARAARVSSTTISQIEKIQKAAAPELVAAVKSGEISINAAAAVASLPVEQQVAAVAGGKKELREAARQVRQAKAQARAQAVGELLQQEPSGDAQAAPWDGEALQALPEGLAPEDALREGESAQAHAARLLQTVARLRAENAALRQRQEATGV